MLPSMYRLIVTNSKILRNVTVRYLSAKKSEKITNPSLDSNEANVNGPKKIYESPLINLSYPNGKKIDVVPLIEAERIAKRRHLQLIKMNDAANRKERDSYKLMETKEFVELEQGDGSMETLGNMEDLGKSATDETALVADEKLKMKERKTLTLHSRMGENDIMTKLKNLQKWIQKMHPANIVVTASDGNIKSAEKIYDTIVKMIGSDGKPVQKLIKNNTLKFQILPTRCLKKK